MQDLIVKTIAHYQLLRRIARGGMADIYLACDTRTDREVAIKLVHKNNEYCARFRQEIETLASLNHKHILPVYDYGEYDGWCYLSMPYIEYGTINERLISGPLSPEAAGELLSQLASALQYAHDQGIIHRDIKPSNVLLKDGTHVYLADFGLVKHVGFHTHLTLSGYLIGTPDYMAPELAESEATPLSDIYALGVLLYQMLTGRVPFKGTSPINVFLKHLSEEPAAPSLLNPEIPLAIEQVILRAMDKNPWHRFESAYELIDAYKRALAIEENEELVELADLATLDPLKVSVMPISSRKTPKTRSLALVSVALLVSASIVLGLTLISLGIQTPHALGNNSGDQVRHVVTATPTVTSTPTIPPTIVVPPDQQQLQVSTSSQTEEQANNSTTQTNSAETDKKNQKEQSTKEQQGSQGNSQDDKQEKTKKKTK
jgi:serine/threonine protein kinase